MTGNLKKAVRFLRKRYPTKTPVTIRVVAKRKGMHGEFLYGDGRALIRICEDADVVMVDTLIEEYAHHVRNECPMPWDEDDHDQVFWAILGAITKAWRES